MNCLKHGYDWPHDKTCPYCDVERLTAEVSALRAVYAAAKPVTENVTPENWCNLKQAVYAVSSNQHTLDDHDCGKAISRKNMSDSLKCYGIVSWEQLLEIAERTGAPEEQPSNSPNWCSDVEFEADEGWKVVIFYDCGGLDYIDHFITPSGVDINFWEWPEDHPWKSYLMSWRGVGDLRRLKAIDAEGQDTDGS